MLTYKYPQYNILHCINLGFSYIKTDQYAEANKL